MFFVQSQLTATSWNTLELCHNRPTAKVVAERMADSMPGVTIRYFDLTYPNQIFTVNTPGKLLRLPVIAGSV